VEDGDINTWVSVEDKGRNIAVYVDDDRYAEETLPKGYAVCRYVEAADQGEPVEREGWCDDCGDTIMVKEICDSCGKPAADERAQTELLPCPCCGGKAEMDGPSWNDGVHCTVCELQ